ncbi:MAG: alanine/glycine:cation symporter family protein, partial [Planctomycetota bacterium]
IGGFMWGPWTFLVLMGAGILFTVWTKFIQFGALGHGVAVTRGKYDDPDDPGAINHFQALSAALSATVGLGNIGGVALAIAGGGPGALFWMWVIGFLGMALKTVEITLAMMFRDTSDPENPHGGAMWVIDRSLGAKGGVFKVIAKILGVFFCITLITSAITGGNMFQSWNVAALTDTYFGVPRVATGILLAVIVGLVIVGGIKRIGTVAGKLVPFMCILYVLTGFAVLFRHVNEIPALVVEIITSAFSREEATGAFLGGTIGWAFSTGLRRALFSNEAGQGSAPIAHAAAKTNEPAREGVVGGIGPFIDTICICTLTALVILSTGTWNRDAAGPFEADVQLVEVENLDDEGNRIPTWRIETTGGVEALPPPENQDEWRAGDEVYFVVEVEGAIRSDTGFNRVQLPGIIEQEDRNAPLVLVWDDVEAGPDDWEGSPTGARLVSDGIFQIFEGAPLTAFAFDLEFPGLGKWLVTLAAWLFAISTMISWSYYGEQGMIYMLGQRSVLLYKLAYLFLVIVAAVWVTDTEDMEALMDLGTGAMLWANMPIVLLMGFVAVRELDTYFKRLKAGEFPIRGTPRFTDVVSGEDVEKD